MIKIDWKKDYNEEFICPNCNGKPMVLRSLVRNKQTFKCLKCGRFQSESLEINIKVVDDPVNTGIKWYANYLVDDFVCPNLDCREKNIYFVRVRDGTKYFTCKSCNSWHTDCIKLTRKNLNRFSSNILPTKTFEWLDDKWDLRAINPNFDPRDTRYIADFTNLQPDCFKNEVKKYVQHLCKADSHLSTISTDMSTLRSFSRFLTKESISNFNEINRSLILNYLAQEKVVNKSKLGGLKKFFTVGTRKGWFTINQDIIRSADYPKQYRGNPDPITDIVKKQIDKNLCQLPDTIARMWLICYFGAMRPSELALLKQDCLIQEGQHWKLVWYRKKGKDYHEVPIDGTIAKIVQDQQEYIKSLWGDEWDYLFCHYQKLSATDISQSKLRPVKKVLPSQSSHPLLVGINTLIKVLNIRDENDRLSKFKLKDLRATRATDIIEQGHGIEIARAWLGQKSSTTTFQYYTKISCDLIEKETGHIHKALVTRNGHLLQYESFPKTFWENPSAHKLELSGTQLNTPLYGFCGLPLDQVCHKFRACFACNCFIATLDKLPQYIDTREKLRVKESQAMSDGAHWLAEQFSIQAEELEKIIASLQQEAA